MSLTEVRPEWLRLLARLGAAWALATLTTLGLTSVVLQSKAARDALKARNDTAISASRRIDMLNGRITELADQLQSAKSDRADLTARIEALSRQVEALGGRPIVIVPASPSTTVRTQVPTTQPQPAPTTATTQPATTTTVARRCVLAPLNPTC